MVRGLLIVVNLVLPMATGCNSNDVPPETIAALRNADQYELLSLDPTRTSEAPPEQFHGWRILGRMKITDAATRRKLNDSLRKGARENDGMAAGCFNPRHGIHLVKGDQVVDLVICFECLAVDVREEGKRGKGFLVSPSPQRVFDQVLRTGDVPLAEKAR
jgi:hypothetical protein